MSNETRDHGRGNGAGAGVAKSRYGNSIEGRALYLDKIHR